MPTYSDNSAPAIEIRAKALAYYPLSSTSQGTDLTENNRDLTIHNGPAVFSGGFMVFDDANDFFLSLPSEGSGSLLNPENTGGLKQIYAEVKPTAGRYVGGNAGRTIIGLWENDSGSPTNNGWWLTLQDAPPGESPKPLIALSTNGALAISAAVTSTGIATGSAHNIVVSFSSGAASLNADGGAASTATFAGTIFKSLADLRIGRTSLDGSKAIQWMRRFLLLNSPLSSDAFDYMVAGGEPFEIEEAVETDTIPASSTLLRAGLNHGSWDTSNSGYIRTVNTGARIHRIFTLPTGGGQIIFNCDNSSYSGVTATKCPQIGVVVDGVEKSLQTLTGSANTVTTGTLTAGDHEIIVEYVGNRNSDVNQYNPGTSPCLMFKVLSLTVPTGTVIKNVQTIPTRWAEVAGDSIPKAYASDGLNTQNSLHGYARYMANQMGVDLCLAAWCGDDFLRPGLGSPYGALNTGDSSGATDKYGMLYQGVPRDYTQGQFLGNFVTLSTNAYFTRVPQTTSDLADPNSSDVNFTASKVSFSTRWHNNHPTRPLIYLIPPGGFLRAAHINAQAQIDALGYNNIRTITDWSSGAPELTSDEQARFSGVDGPADVATDESADGVHILDDFARFFGENLGPKVTAVLADIASPSTVATPTFSPPAGAVAAGTVVTISTATAGATIHRTLNGTTATASSPSGTTVTITGAMTLHAIGVKAGQIDSNQAIAAYTVSPDSPDLGTINVTLTRIAIRDRHATFYLRGKELLTLEITGIIEGLETGDTYLLSDTVVSLSTSAVSSPFPPDFATFTTALTAEMSGSNLEATWFVGEGNPAGGVRLPLVPGVHKLWLQMVTRTETIVTPGPTITVIA